MKRTCRCFGYSGSCTYNACWLVLPSSFRQVGAHLKERFDSASKVSFGNKGQTFDVHDKSMKKPTPEDLVYTTDAPSFCDPNPSVGSLGTSGRYCNATSMGTDGCDIMCCGRHYDISVELSKKPCMCTFHWCCSVKCKTCTVEKTVNTCRWISLRYVTDREPVGFDRRELGDVFADAYCGEWRKICVQNSWRKTGVFLCKYCSGSKPFGCSRTNALVLNRSRTDTNYSSKHFMALIFLNAETMWCRNHTNLF